jgi:hypothetical protein
LALDLAPHFPLEIILLPPVNQLCDGIDRLLDEGRQVEVRGIVGSRILRDHAGPSLPKEAIDGEAGRAESDALGCLTLALEVGHESLQKFELLRGGDALLTVFPDDFLQPLSQRLIEGRVLVQAHVDLVANGVLHLACFGLGRAQSPDPLLEFLREERDFF